MTLHQNPSINYNVFLWGFRGDLVWSLLINIDRIFYNYIIFIYMSSICRNIIPNVIKIREQ